MTIGPPIDPSIRRLTITSKSTSFSIPDSQGNLDPDPQLLMEPGDEQFSFQYPDNLGDGRDQYDGYNQAGGGSNPSTGITIDDFISILVEKPTNKTYIVGYSIPFPVQILGTAYTFGTGPGVATFQSGTINTGNNITMVVTGTTGASANLSARISTRTNQAG